MNKKVFTLTALVASMMFGATAHAADTRICLLYTSDAADDLLTV